MYIWRTAQVISSLWRLVSEQVDVNVRAVCTDVCMTHTLVVNQINLSFVPVDDMICNARCQEAMCSKVYCVSGNLRFCVVLLVIIW